MRRRRMIPILRVTAHGNPFRVVTGVHVCRTNDLSGSVLQFPVTTTTTRTPICNRVNGWTLQSESSHQLFLSHLFGATVSFFVTTDVPVWVFGCDMGWDIDQGIEPRIWSCDNYFCKHVLLISNIIIIVMLVWDIVFCHFFSSFCLLLVPRNKTNEPPPPFDKDSSLEWKRNKSFSLSFFIIFWGNFIQEKQKAKSAKTKQKQILTY